MNTDMKGASGIAFDAGQNEADFRLRAFDSALANSLSTEEETTLEQDIQSLKLNTLQTALKGQPYKLNDALKEVDELFKKFPVLTRPIFAALSNRLGKLDFDSADAAQFAVEFKERFRNGVIDKGEFITYVLNFTPNVNVEETKIAERAFNNIKMCRSNRSMESETVEIGSDSELAFAEQKKEILDKIKIIQDPKSSEKDISDAHSDLGGNGALYKDAQNGNQQALGALLFEKLAGCLDNADKQKLTNYISQKYGAWNWYYNDGRLEYISDPDPKNYSALLDAFGDAQGYEYDERRRFLDDPLVDFRDIKEEERKLDTKKARLKTIEQSATDFFSKGIEDIYADKSYTQQAQIILSLARDDYQPLRQALLENLMGNDAFLQKYLRLSGPADTAEMKAMIYQFAIPDNFIEQAKAMLRWINRGRPILTPR